MKNKKNIFDRVIKTDRLLLRKITKNDVDNIFEYTSDDACTRFLSWESHKEKSQAENFIKKTLEEYEESTTRFSYGIELVSEKKIIGVLSIFDIRYISKGVEISYILNSNYQGKGFMKEALSNLIIFLFKEKNLIRIQAKCTIDNRSSEKLMIKTGMIREGKLRKYWMIKGVIKDVLIYSIINDEK